MPWRRGSWPKPAQKCNGLLPSRWDIETVKLYAGAADIDPSGHATLPAVEGEVVFSVLAVSAHLPDPSPRVDAPVEMLELHHVDGACVLIGNFQVTENCALSFLARDVRLGNETPYRCRNWSKN